MKAKPNIDEEIFCSMSRLYAKSFNLPPLAAMIYSYLIFDFESNGLTFNDLVETFSASKSSISTNLNLLINNKLIKDINKLEERKRYFVVNEEFTKLRLEEIVERLKEEKEILNALYEFNRNGSSKSISKLRTHQTILEKSISNIEESLSKL